MTTGTYGPNLSPPAVGGQNWFRRSWKYFAVAAVSLIAGAAMAGSGSSTKTTAPAKASAPIVHTKIVTHTKTVTKTPVTCKVAILGMKSSALSVVSAYQVIAAQILPAYKAGLYGGSVQGIVAKVQHATGLVKQANAKLTKVIPDGQACMSG
jgi:hypothetical protein